MKLRKVIITIETETGQTIKALQQWKGKYVGPCLLEVVVDQIQVNIVKPNVKL